MISIIHLIDWNLITFLAGLGLGWYLRGRGLAGVEVDATNVKNVVENAVKAI